MESTPRLRAVSLFLKNRGEECKTNERASMTVNVMCERRCGVGMGRRVKRETVLVSYNDLDTTLTGRINDTSALF